MFFMIQIIVFLSAFLLFTLEFIIGKIFLSAFGGSYLIWGGCLVFFQLMLLLGYRYSQIVTERLDLRKYRLFHFLLFLLPLVSFPGRTLPFQYDMFNVPIVF